MQGKKTKFLSFTSQGAPEQPASSTDPRPRPAPHHPERAARPGDELYPPLHLPKCRASLSALLPAATPVPPQTDAPRPSPSSAQNSHNSPERVCQAKRLNAWLLNDGTTLALIRGSNYLGNGGHGPRSFTLIEFQYLPPAACSSWLPQSSSSEPSILLALPPVHLPARWEGARCRQQQAGGWADTSLPATPVRTQRDSPEPFPSPTRRHRLPSSAPRAAEPGADFYAYNQKNAYQSKLKAENHNDLCSLSKHKQLFKKKY